MQDLGFNFEHFRERLLGRDHTLEDDVLFALFHSFFDRLSLSDEVELVIDQRRGVQEANVEPCPSPGFLLLALE